MNFFAAFKRWILLLTNLSVAVTAFSYNFAVEGIFYNINVGSSTVTVTYDSYLSGCYSGDIIVPDSVDYNGQRYAVVRIGNEAFRSCTELTSIKLPDELIRIGESAFRDCSALAKVTLGKGLTEIAGYAFDKCGSLSLMELPKSVTSIGECVFRDCTSLTYVTLPTGLTTIGSWAFCNCYALSSVEIPGKVTEIGGGAFKSCHSLNNVTINRSDDKALHIGRMAFVDCPAIETTVTNDIDLWCGITFDDPHANPLNISNSITVGGETVRNLVIGDGVKSIGKYAFYHCDPLRRISLPKSMAAIGDSAFWHCYNLADVTSLSEMPPTVGKTFVEEAKASTSLTVPFGSAALYRESDIGRIFSIIKELPGNRKGDVNGDGSVDGGDVSILLEMVLMGDVSSEQE